MSTPLVTAAQKAPLAGLDAYVEHAMRDWNVPGLAIAIVRNDSVILAKGYGVRDIGKPGNVDANTVFAIASTTKAFTSASMGMLVDEGKVTWDDTVRKWLPYFQLKDPYVTEAFAIRDLLTHRSGLERGDFLWAATNYDREQVVRHLRYLNMEHPFRTTYGYSNNMFITAGTLIAAVTGKPWDDFVKQRIFTPLGMTRTNTSVKDLVGMDNVASPHEPLRGKLIVVPYWNLDNEGPGGSINSSVNDMAQWLRLQLAGGTYEGHRLVSQKSLEETHTPQTTIRLTPHDFKLLPDPHYSNYAMGWQVQDYRGKTMVEHGGAIDGMRSRVVLIPESHFGFVILTNRGQGNVLYDAIRNRVLDAMLGAPARDWSKEYLTVSHDDSVANAKENASYEASRVKGTKPSLALAQYAGTYVNEAYGNATFTVEDGHLVMRIGPHMVGDLSHWHYDTFRSNWRGGDDWGMVTFYLDDRGQPTKMWTAGFGDFERMSDSSTTTNH
jgi:CubicO group peptidase (beta-lactamase class C family)